MDYIWQMRGRRDNMGSVNLNNDEIPFLAVPLPEDILKLKWAGEFEQADRVIDRRLKNRAAGGCPLPTAC